MDAQELKDTAKALVADDKGLLAMDESNPTCNRRFAKLGIPQTVEARRAYRELIVTTPSLGESISGAILYDETIRQEKKDGTPFIKIIADEGINPGIKVDTGAKELAGPSRQVQPGCSSRRIQCRDGQGMSRTTSIRQLTKPAAKSPRVGRTALSIKKLSEIRIEDIPQVGLHERKRGRRSSCARSKLEEMILKPAVPFPLRRAPREAHRR